MIRWIVATLLITQTAFGITIVDKNTGSKIQSNRVVAIKGSITEQTASKFKSDVTNSIDGSSDLIVLINSPGGIVPSGKEIIDAIEAEKAKKVRVVCVVLKEASSMAFNILTRCDLRLALPKSIFLFHPVSIQLPCGTNRFTPKVLLEIIKDLEKDEEEFRSANVKALDMTVEEYDAFANKETRWRAETLLARKYLHGIVNITP